MYVYGIASTSDQDTGGYVLLPGCFDLSKLPPLLYAHDRRCEAGKILYLGYHGNKLYCRARVTSPAAQKAGFFSVGGRVLEANGNVVTKGRLLEVSLVHEPANLECKILQRSDRDPMGDLMELQSVHWDNLSQAFLKLRGVVEELERF